MLLPSSPNALMTALQVMRTVAKLNGAWIIHEHLAYSYGVGPVGDRMSDIIVRHGEDGDERSASLSSSVMSCLSVAIFCKSCAADARTKCPTCIFQAHQQPA